MSIVSLHLIEYLNRMVCLFLIQVPSLKLLSAYGALDNSGEL